MDVRSAHSVRRPRLDFRPRFPGTLLPPRSRSLAASNILFSENWPAGAAAKIAGEMIAAPAYTNGTT